MSYLFEGKTFSTQKFVPFSAPIPGMAGLLTVAVSKGFASKLLSSGEQGKIHMIRNPSARQTSWDSFVYSLGLILFDRQITLEFPLNCVT